MPEKHENQEEQPRTAIFNKNALLKSDRCIVVTNIKGFPCDGEVYTADNLDQLNKMRRDAFPVEPSRFGTDYFQQIMSEFAKRREQEIILAAGALFVMTGGDKVMEKLQTRFDGIFNIFFEDRQIIEEIIESPEIMFSENDNFPLLEGYEIVA